MYRRTRYKYNARPTMVEGIRFASRAEARRYQELRLLESAGKIAKLERQPRYPIEYRGMHICNVILDFRYLQLNSRSVTVEDVKGRDLPMSRLKRKLLRAFYGISVEIIK